MNIKKLSRSCILLCVLLVTAVQSQTSIPPSAGDGSLALPYQINSIENIQWIAQTPAVWKSAFVQTCDINAASTKNWNSWSGGTDLTFEGLRPIGIDSAFCGVYDGKGFVIDSLHQSLGNSTSTGLGLFSQISEATIKNVTITNAAISNYYSTTSVLAAVANNSTIQNCKVSGTVNGKIEVTGGLIGRLINSSISDCQSSVSVSGGNGTGGLIGIMTAGNLEKSSCTAPVSGVMQTGGLVGIAGAESAISNCFHQGEVHGSYSVGGLFGIIGSKVTIRYCYNAGFTLDENDKSAAEQYSRNDSTSVVESIHWDATLARLTKNLHPENPGNTTSEMYQQATFTGWNFDSVWSIVEGVEYPQLRQYNGIISTLPYRQLPDDILIGIYHQGNRIKITGKMDCLITIMNLQGQVCLREKTSELALHGLLNGRYIAFVQSAEKTEYSLHKKVIPFTISR